MIPNMFKSWPTSFWFVGKWTGQSWFLTAWWELVAPLMQTALLSNSDGYLPRWYWCELVKHSRRFLLVLKVCGRSKQQHCSDWPRFGQFHSIPSLYSTRALIKSLRASNQWQIARGTATGWPLSLSKTGTCQAEPQSTWILTTLYLDLWCLPNTRFVHEIAGLASKRLPPWFCLLAIYRLRLVVPAAKKRS